MKAGVFMYTQNSWDNVRFSAFEGNPSKMAFSKRDADNSIWAEDLRFGDLVEPLGFDDIWTVEHHFSPYAQTTNPLQFLSYWAGRTERVGMGTMVVVLPWHHPMRVAEELVMLQYMLGDRDLTPGFGRGAARREYGGFNIQQSDSRERFDESVEVLKLALGQERFAYDGKHFTIPDASQRPMSPHLSLRPTPLDGERLLNSMHAAWGSPGSAPLLAAHGLKPLIIPQRAMVHYEQELANFYEAGAKAGYEAANPIAAQWVYCSAGKDALERGADAYLANMASADVNYEFSSGYHSGVKGYEHYGDQIPNSVTSALTENTYEALIGDLIAGTPEQCIAKIQELTDMLHPKQWNFDFKFGNLTYDEAEKSIKLFAKEVLPFVHGLAVKPPKVSVAASA